MLETIMINGVGYEVELLNENQVKDDILNHYTMSLSEKEILRDIDNYEKIEFENKHYFINKSKLPLVWNTKISNTSNINYGANIVLSFISPINGIINKTYHFINNIKNFIKVKTKKDVFVGEDNKYDTLIFMLSSVIYFSFFKEIMNFIPLNFDFIGGPASSFVFYFTCVIINVFVVNYNRSIYKYNNIKNYNLPDYTFNVKYINASKDSTEKLKNMKVKKSLQVDFLFSDGKEKTQ